MVKKEIIWSPQAEMEQLKILEFYFRRNGNKKYSQKLYDEFRNSIELIIKFPKIGLNTDIENVRVVNRGDFSIFYRIHPDIIEVLSIWDNRQNPEENKFNH